jgi:hypothetical protein
MNNTTLFIDKKYFEILCISDYIHFIYSFYITIFIKEPVLVDILKKSLLALSDKEVIKNGITSNKIKEKFELYKAMGPKLINEWFNMLESQKIDPKSIFTGELFRWLVEPEPKKIIPSRLVIKKSATTNRNNQSNNNVGYFSNTLRRRSERKIEVERQAHITVNIPESVEEEYNTNKLNEFNNKQFEKKPKNNTSGAMSRILVSPDGTQLFKQLKPGYKKYHSNECQVYNLLQEISPQYIDERTCFIRCYKNGILLRYGGISLYQMIKERKIPNISWFERLFTNIKIIHLAGIAHNDLHCKNIVGDGAFLIDFGLAKISDTDIDEDTRTFLNFIDNFFFNFLFIFSEGIIS